MLRSGVLGLVDLSLAWIVFLLECHIFFYIRSSRWPKGRTKVVFCCVPLGAGATTAVAILQIKYGWKADHALPALMLMQTTFVEAMHTLQSGISNTGWTPFTLALFFGYIIVAAFALAVGVLSEYRGAPLSLATNFLTIFLCAANYLILWYAHPIYGAPRSTTIVERRVILVEIIKKPRLILWLLAFLAHLLGLGTTVGLTVLWAATGETRTDLIRYVEIGLNVVALLGFSTCIFRWWNLTKSWCRQRKGFWIDPKTTCVAPRDDEDSLGELHQKHHGKDTLQISRESLKVTEETDEKSVKEIV